MTKAEMTRQLLDNGHGPIEAHELVTNGGQALNDALTQNGLIEATSSSSPSPAERSSSDNASDEDLTEQLKDL